VISIVVISKDEPALAATLADLAAERARVDEPTEVVVVDASDGRLDHIRDAHPDVLWLPFRRPPGVRVSIPHQRNAGVAAATGDVVVFTDAGCRPHAGWLARLVAPLAAGEQVVAGVATSPGGGGLYDTHAARVAAADYLTECPTINMAFRRSAFDAVGGFDEGFEYGSDIDFSWRLADAGFRIRCARDAVVEHDWGTPGRQLKRSYRYGRARTRLYRKHLRRLPMAPRTDPMVLVYPLFLLGLPIALRHRSYLALLLLPAWRNRAEGPVRVLVDHLAFGLGVLRELGPRR
jgi:glycosyltransferase involved in cell wall biosynthesis